LALTRVKVQAVWSVR